MEIGNIKQNMLDVLNQLEESKKVLVNGKETFNGTVVEFLKSNFEIVVEKKGLQVWDAKMCHPKSLVYKQEDIKEALNNSIKRIQTEDESSVVILEQEFGKELVN